MDLPALLEQYGYALIFFGTLVEGESILMLGGYFAHRGYLDLGTVIITAFAGALCGDQLFFYIGRHHARGLLARFPKLRDKVNVALRRVEDHQVKVVLTMRFLWGLRIALPVALGLTNMSAKRFLWLNLISAAVWSSVFAVVGFGASRVFSALVANLHRHEKWIVAVLLLITVIALVWHLGRPQRARP
ncbi:MAG TPA: DedA family protein [Steroidobacteraceae bacterium]|nr:DedA family protein [Steroidobacteraceae bacterium]